MMRSRKQIASIIAVCIYCVGLAQTAQAQNSISGIQLTPRGKELLTQYTDELSSLNSEIEAALPTIAPDQKQAFLDARSALAMVSNCTNISPVPAPFDVVSLMRAKIPLPQILDEVAQRKDNRV